MIDLIHPFWKPADWTSFDVVKKVRAAVSVRKVGHAGSLDPFAEGVLILCFGAATKQVSQLMDLDKEYITTLKLGAATDTLDPTGEVVASEPVPTLTHEGILESINPFVGTIQQVPPMYSALKVNGKRLYRLAREGKMITREPRKVLIHSIALIQWRPPDEVDLKVVCGKGTYIRSLGADIARALGTVGYLTCLTRSRVGPYREADAIRMEQLASWNPIVA